MVLPDLIAPDLDLLFCGTAASAASAQRQAYYAGPGNAFWPTLHKVGLTPRLLAPTEYAQLLSWSMGLTDLAKQVSGNDDTLLADHFDVVRVRALVQRYRPHILAFTSKRAAQHYLGGAVEYGELEESEGDTRIFVLPSPSGAARRYWTEVPWRELARLKAALAALRQPFGR